VAAVPRRRLGKAGPPLRTKLSNTGMDAVFYPFLDFSMDTFSDILWRSAFRNPNTQIANSKQIPTINTQIPNNRFGSILIHNWFESWVLEF